MRLLFLILAIVVFLVLAIIAIAGGTWDSVPHLFALMGLGSAFFAAAFLPFPGTPVA